MKQRSSLSSMRPSRREQHWRKQRELRLLSSHRMPNSFLASSTPPGLSHEQQQQLREELKAHGIGKQGRSRSVPELLVAVSFTSQLARLDQSFDAAVKLAAATINATPSTVRSAYEEYSSSGSITPPETSHRGSGNPNHPRSNSSKLPLQGELIIHSLLQTVQKKNTQETITTLRAALAQQGFDVSRTTVFRRLHELSYQYTNKRFIGATSLKVLHHRRRAFAYRMAAARRLEKEGTHVLVGTDESYAHQRKGSGKIWASPLHPDSRLVSGDANGGRRLIILHAMTRHRLLHVEGVEPESDLTQVQHSTELVFESHGDSDGDYHKCMNGETFVLWLKNRLLPSFTALYPGKKMILLLDNVKYHHHRGPAWITPRLMDQDALAVTLAEHVPEFTVTRGNGKFAKKITIKKRYYQSAFNAKPPGPYKKELVTELEKWLAEHPQVTEVRRVMEAAGHQLLYTPPFQPEVQPIELLWGKMKKEVARQNVRGRTIQQTKTQVQAALRSTAQEDYARFFTETEKYLERWVASDEELLQFGNFASMVDSPALAYKSSDPEEEVDEEYSEDEKEESKNGADADSMEQ